MQSAPLDRGDQAGQIFETQQKNATSETPRQAAIRRVDQAAQLEAATLCLEFLDKTRAPKTSAYRLKHFAEGRWPTLFGYVEEAMMLRAAARLGIPVKGHLIAVKLPKARRGRRHL